MKWEMNIYIRTFQISVITSYVDMSCPWYHTMAVLQNGNHEMLTLMNL